MIYDDIIPTSVGASFAGAFWHEGCGSQKRRVGTEFPGCREEQCLFVVDDLFPPPKTSRHGPMNRMVSLSILGDLDFRELWSGLKIGE